MIMSDLIQLIKEWRFQVQPIDLYNWIKHKVELTHLERKLFVAVPGDESLIERNSTFGKAVAQICKQEICLATDKDIVDRFKSHGKLWLVFRDGRVVDESTTRLTRSRCRICQGVPEDKTLFSLQGDLCIPCFSGDMVDYRISLWRKALVRSGRSYNYDPVPGTLRLNFRTEVSDGRTEIRWCA